MSKNEQRPSIRTAKLASWPVLKLLAEVLNIHVFRYQIDKHGGPWYYILRCKDGSDHEERFRRQAEIFMYLQQVAEQRGCAQFNDPESVVHFEEDYRE